MKIEWVVLIAIFVVTHFVEVIFAPYFSVYPLFLLAFLVSLMQSRFANLGVILALFYAIALGSIFKEVPIDGVMPLLLMTFLILAWYLFSVFGRGLLQTLIFTYLITCLVLFASLSQLILFGFDKVFVLLFAFVFFKFVMFLEKTFR